MAISIQDIVQSSLPKGDQGFTGSQGVVGFTGSLGDTGPQGVVGFVGSQGVVGFVGSQGSPAPKSVSIINPTSNENIVLFYTPIAITISALWTALRGSTPSVTFTIRHASTRSAAGTELVTGGSTVTSTAGATITSFNNASISAGSWVWITTSAATNATEFHVSVFF
jgi:hypothetical protein